MIREGLRHGHSPADWEAAKREAIAILCDRAGRRTNQTIAYSELTTDQSIQLDPHGVPLAHMLGEISTEEDAAGRGMLTVLVVHKGSIEPGPGFFVSREIAWEGCQGRSQVLERRFRRVTELHRKR